MRNSDSTNVNEYAISQKPRHFYPAFSFSASSESNMPESFVTNEGLYSSTSKKPYFLFPSVPSIKNNFATRILYSDIHVTDAFKNGYKGAFTVFNVSLNKPFSGSIPTRNPEPEPDCKLKCVSISPLFFLRVYAPGRNLS